MLSVILSFVVIFGLGIVLPSFLSQSTYGSKLEDYVNSRNPVDTYDVEKYTREYEEKQHRGIL